ncbi:Plug domain-containing protein, partial [Candidatus Poribacteria bacterium]|nr:Plug domain-containing protein [Candidatus Poribacteria bacterium]
MKKTLIYLIICCLVPFSAIAETEDTATSEFIDGEAENPVTTLDPITIEGKRIERKSRQTLEGELLKKTPGSAGDPLRGIARLPSVATINDFLGVLSVRGGAPEDNLYYFDRLPLGYPYHLLGIVSVVSSEVVGGVNVYPGGFGAEFGADAQAVIDIHSVPKNKESLGRFDATIKPSFIYSEAFFNGAFDFSNRSENLKAPEGNKSNETSGWNDQ